MPTSEIADFLTWVAAFEAEAMLRQTAGDPGWSRGVRLDAAVLRSIQRFQVGENGDGANLIAKAGRAGDDAYTAAVRLFVAEEQNHARQLACLLAAADVPTLTGHWSDTAFVRLRRMLGLRLELMVLMLAEVVALRYYQALRDGSGDRLTSDVAGRILADEQRHVPFHCLRLRVDFARMPRAARAFALAAWWAMMAATLAVVAADHGAALRRLGLTRTRFVRDVGRLFAAVTRETALSSGRGARRAGYPAAGSAVVARALQSPGRYRARP
jgi:hypothetical protein